jgi:hypothetical protein
MKLTERTLKRIIAEEMSRAESEKRTLQRRRRRRLAEGTRSNPVYMTPERINAIIAEEYELYMHKQRLAESRRRMQSRRRNRR